MGAMCLTVTLGACFEAEPEEAAHGSKDEHARVAATSFDLRATKEITPHVAQTKRTAKNRSASALDTFVIVLDPGHGAEDHGAHGPDRSRESHLVLDIARRAKESLRRRIPNAKVLLTRADDTFVSLEQRAVLANEVGADVFVSIHLNAAPDEVERGGVTTFVLDTTQDRQAIRLAARENGTSTASVSDVEVVLASLHRAQQTTRSRTLAQWIQMSTVRSGRTVLPSLGDRGVRSAMFYVLVGATMPSALVEASFLTREDEGAALQTASYRQALAEGIAAGIARYFLIPTPDRGPRSEAHARP